MKRRDVSHSGKPQMAQDKRCKRVSAHEQFEAGVRNEKEYDRRWSIGK